MIRYKASILMRVAWIIMLVHTESTIKIVPTYQVEAQLATDRSLRSNHVPRANNREPDRKTRTKTHKNSRRQSHRMSRAIINIASNNSSSKRTKRSSKCKKGRKKIILRRIKIRRRRHKNYAKTRCKLMNSISR